MKNEMRQKPSEKEAMDLEEAAEKTIQLLQDLHTRQVSLEELVDELYARIAQLENRLDGSRAELDFGGDWG